MKLSEIKSERERKTSALIAKCGVFFAFSDAQFAEGKTPLEEGDKYVSLGIGGYMPKSKVDMWRAGISEIGAWFKELMQDKKLREENIVYELHNHEAFYTGEIDDTLDALGSDYTREEVIAVFNNQHEEQC